MGLPAQAPSLLLPLIDVAPSTFRFGISIEIKHILCILFCARQQALIIARSLSHRKFTFQKLIDRTN